MNNFKTTLLIGLMKGIAKILDKGKWVIVYSLYFLASWGFVELGLMCARSKMFFFTIIGAQLCYCIALILALSAIIHFFKYKVFGYPMEDGKGT